MTDDTAITDRLQKLAEDTDYDAPEHTIILDEMDLMATTEFKRLARPASATDTSDADDGIENANWDR